MQLRAAFGDQKVMTKDEFDKQRAALLSGLRAAAKCAPVEDVGMVATNRTAGIERLVCAWPTLPYYCSGDPSKAGS